MQNVLDDKISDNGILYKYYQGQLKIFFGSYQSLRPLTWVAALSRYLCKMADGAKATL